MELNLLALILAAIAPMILGFIWYHDKVFGNAWLESIGMSKETMNAGNMLKIFGGFFVCSIILAFGLNIIATHDAFIAGALYYETNGAVEPDPNSESGKWMQYYMDKLAASNHTFQHGAYHGLLIGGIFITLPIIISDALFEHKGWKYVAIKAGFWLISLAVMGGILASMG